VSFDVRFVRELAFGACAVVELPEGDDFSIPLGLEEVLHAAMFPAERRATWVGGRVALHAALDALGASFPGAILGTPRGAPVLPAGFTGSVSHKPTLAVALVGRVDPAAPATVGIDLELPRPLRYDIAPRVLTPDEQTELAERSGDARDLEVLRRFAAKEAIYKALDPWVGRFVSFQEAVTARRADGRLCASLALSGGEGPFSVELAEESGEPSTILMAARIRRAPGG
jgi:4'-phosphopantetheinyl transferase EntD